jgi:hypothetical protein
VTDRSGERLGKVTWERTIKVWWSVAWRGVLYGFLGGFALGAIGGVIAVAMHEPGKVAVYGKIGGYLAGIPAFLFALKQALQKHLAALAALANGGSA